MRVGLVSIKLHSLSIIVNRVDGLGERLRAILYGYYLSKCCNLGFGFYWSSDKYAKKFHAIEAVEGVFSNDFIDRYYLGGRLPDSHKYISLSPNNKLSSELLAQHANGESGGFLLKDLDISRVVEAEMLLNCSISLHKTFGEIEFSDNLKSVLSLVEKVILGTNSVAVHVRGGDIVYGPYRFTQRFQNKALPLPIVKYLVRELIKQGKSPVVFVQDKVVNEIFRGEAGVVLATDFRKKLNTELERAFFDIILMSRCHEIIAGSSGFSKLAAEISGKSVRRPTDHYSPEEMAAIIKDDLKSESKYDNLSLAFSWFVYSLYGELSLPSEEIDAVLLKAQTLDPDNSLYPLKRMINFLIHNSETEAEALVHEVIEGFNKTENPLKTRFFRALTHRSGRKFVMQRYFQSFIRCEDITRPYIQFCKAYIYYVSRNTRECFAVLDKIGDPKNYPSGMQNCIKHLNLLLESESRI